MADHRVFELDGRTQLNIVTTDRGDGDFSIDADRGTLELARRCIIDCRWSWMRQVHGATVEVVRQDPVTGVDADGLVTRQRERPLAVQTADCAAVVLYDHEGTLGVCHAGWRGLLGGIVAETARMMRNVGGSPVGAFVGPCIGSECYTFGEGELGVLSDRFGVEVEATDATGRPALDLRAGVTVALRELGIDDPAIDQRCTSCSRDHWSYRGGGDAHRHTTVAWTSASGAGQ